MHSLDRSAALPVLLEPSTYTMTQKTAWKRPSIPHPKSLSAF
jgi:hypothetical protein